MFRLTILFAVVCLIGLGINLEDKYNKLNQPNQGWYNEKGIQFVASPYVLTSYVASEKNRVYYHDTVKKDVVNMYLPSGKKSKSMSYFELTEYVNYYVNKDGIYPANIGPAFRKMVEALNKETGYNPAEPLYISDGGSTCSKNNDGDAIEPSIVSNVLFIGCLDCVKYLVDEWKVDLNVHYCTGLSLAEVIIRDYHGYFPELIKLGFDPDKIPKEYRQNTERLSNILDSVVGGNWARPYSKMINWNYETGYVDPPNCYTTFNGEKWNMCTGGRAQLARYFMKKGFLDYSSQEAINLCNSDTDKFIANQHWEIINRSIIPGIMTFWDGKPYLEKDPFNKWNGKTILITNKKGFDEYANRVRIFEMDSSNRFCGKAYYTYKKYCDNFNIYCDEAVRYKKHALRGGMTEQEFGWIAKSLFDHTIDCEFTDCIFDSARHNYVNANLFPSGLRNQDEPWFWIDYNGSTFEDNADPVGYWFWKNQELSRIYGFKNYTVGNL